jgi:hypothetical protein
MEEAVEAPIRCRQITESLQSVTQANPELLQLLSTVSCLLSTQSLQTFRETRTEAEVLSFHDFWLFRLR